MKHVSDHVFRWLPEDRWEFWICDEMKRVIDSLEKKGISVIKVGEQNYKAPEGLIFVDSSFDIGALLGELGVEHGCTADSGINGVSCHKHYVSLLHDSSLHVSL